MTTDATWHTDPPEWASYINGVMLANRGTELHFDIDMACKRVDVDAVACEDGRVVITFHVDISDGPVKWPDDPGPWTHENRSPTLTLDMGAALTPDMYVAACGTGRYTTRVVCLRRVDWGVEGVDVCLGKRVP